MARGNERNGETPSQDRITSGNALWLRAAELLSAGAGVRHK